MKLTNIISVILLAIVPACTADYMWVDVYCYLTCRYPAYFTTNFGSYQVDADSGCRGTSVPGMVEFCIDWPASRGHFRFSHQDFKGCLSITYFDDSRDCGIAYCQSVKFDEVPCTWRMASEPGEEGLVLESAIANVTTPAVQTGTAKEVLPKSTSAFTA